MPPISTPPNAVVFAAGRIETRDLLGGGLPIGLAAPLVFRRMERAGPRLGAFSSLYNLVFIFFL
jgi:hypothetical protein